VQAPGVIIDRDHEICYNTWAPTALPFSHQLQEERTTMQDSYERVSTGEPVPATVPPEVPDVPPPEETSNTRRNIAIAAGVIIILALVVLAIYGMVSYPLVTSVIRDISIIVLALVTILIGLFLVILLFQLQSLIVLLRDEIQPILHQTNRTVSTVKGTTTFMSEAITKPAIEAASLAAGLSASVRQTLNLFKGDRRKKK
jgi:hypothetical protein